MKTRILVKEGEYRLAKAGVMDAKIDSEELFCYATKCDKVVMFLQKEEEVDKETEGKYFKLIEKRASRIPLQHITGEQEFMGFKFKVSPKVLIPRQDTETLVTEAAKVLLNEQKRFEEEREKKSFFGKLKSPPTCAEVLDLCCGSGAIGISLVKICTDIFVTATDNSREALELAAANADINRVGLDFIKGDMFSALTDGEHITAQSIRSGAGGKSGAGSFGLGKRKGKGSRVTEFDMIVSNPPYIKTNSIAMLQEEVKGHEPIEALDGGRDGLDFYRIIVGQAADHLKKGGWLIMEIGFDQGEDLRKMIMDSGKYTIGEIVKDLPGKDRVVKCQKL